MYGASVGLYRGTAALNTFVLYGSSGREIAYRRGIGRIIRSVWEKRATEEDITLG
jgi:hypothetical protein